MIARMLLGAGLLLLALAAPKEARAETDCEHFQRILATLREGAQKVEEHDIAKAMQTERLGYCKAATFARTVPAPTPYIASASAASTGLLAGIPTNALNQGYKVSCPHPMRPDPNSQSPCDWFALALAYQKGFGVLKDPAQALVWLEKAARANHAAAQMGLGEAYQAGYGPLDPNPAGAHHWMVMAAQNGNPVAARLLGSYAEQGTGQPINHVEAAYWYQQALDRGEVAGAVWLGVLYANGKGVAKDPMRATNLFRLAAEAGNTDGMYYLGDFYRMGIGVPFDLAQARYWLRKAQAAGDKDAPRILAYMDEVDRRYASAPPVRVTDGYAASSGPSLSEQAMETHRRQYRENCAAAGKGANRACYIP